MEKIKASVTKKIRTTYTADEIRMVKTDNVWTIKDAKTGAWFHALPTEHFVIFALGQANQMGVKDTETEIAFQRPDGEPVTVGYDRGTKTIYLDINPKAFMKKKNKDFFRIQQMNR